MTADKISKIQKDEAVFVAIFLIYQKNLIAYQRIINC